MGNGDKGAASSRWIIPLRFIPVNQLGKQRGRGHRLLVSRFILTATAFNCCLIRRLAAVCPGFAQIALLKVFRWGGGFLHTLFSLFHIGFAAFLFLLFFFFFFPTLVGWHRGTGAGGKGETEARSLAIMRSDKIFVWANERLGPPSPPRCQGGIPGSPIINIPPGSPPPQAKALGREMRLFEYL